MRMNLSVLQKCKEQLKIEMSINYQKGSLALGGRGWGGGACTARITCLRIAACWPVQGYSLLELQRKGHHKNTCNSTSIRTKARSHAISNHLLARELTNEVLCLGGQKKGRAVTANTTQK